MNIFLVYNPPMTFRVIPLTNRQTKKHRSNRTREEWRK